jgi:photosystem II stability/assembly factor-like uncharacterized protein
MMIRAAAATLLSAVVVIVAATGVVALGAVGSWRPTSAPLPGYITSVVASPVYSFDAIVWLATDSGGVLRSSDGGISFATANRGLDDLAVRALAPSPLIHLDGVVLASTESGLYRSSDRGLRWTPSLGIPVARVAAVAFSPKFGTGGPIYAAVSGHGLYRSFDLGRTWTRFAAAGLTDKTFRGMAVADGTNEQVHIAIWTRDKVFLSNNSGSIFNDISGADTLPDGLKFESAALAPDYGASTTLWLGTRSNGIRRSTDGGASYARVLGGGAGRVRTFAFSPMYANDGLILAGTSSGGVYRSRNPADPGATWTPRNVNLAFSDVTSFAFSNDFRDDGTIFAVGAQGRVAFTKTAGDDWWTIPLVVTTARIGGLSLPAVDTLLAGTPQGFQVSDDRGVSWSMRNRQLPATNIIASAASPNFTTDGIAIIGIEAEGVFRTTSSGEFWAMQNAGLTTAMIRSPRAFAFSPDLANDNTVFAAGTDGVFRSRTGGSTWELLTGGVPPGITVVALAVSPSFAADDTLFAGTLGAGVYRSTDAGDAWQPANQGLPDLTVRGLAVSPAFATDLTVLVATDGGLFLSTDAGATWTQTSELTRATAVAFSPAFAWEGSAFAGGPAPRPPVVSTTDRGRVWTQLGETLLADAILQLVPSPAYAAGGELFAATTDAGVQVYTVPGKA